MSDAIDQNANEILSYWFGEPEDTVSYSQGRSKIWFGGDAETDRDIRQRYLPLLEKFTKGELDHWKQHPKSALALIILLDQFTRNIYRDQAKAYDFDPQSLQLAKDCVDRGIDKQMLCIERVFVYLPYEHSENIEDQKESLKLFEGILQDAPEDLKQSAESYLLFAKKHYDVVAEFGRFPHRNSLLGRESTNEEIKFLEAKGRGF